MTINTRKLLQNQNDKSGKILNRVYNTSWSLNFKSVDTVFHLKRGVDEI